MLASGVGCANELKRLPNADDDPPGAKPVLPEGSPVMLPTTDPPAPQEPEQVPRVSLLTVVSVRLKDAVPPAKKELFNEATPTGRPPALLAAKGVINPLSGPAVEFRLP